jgi:hypothetical protein
MLTFFDKRLMESENDGENTSDGDSGDTVRIRPGVYRATLFNMVRGQSLI